MCDRNERQSHAVVRLGVTAMLGLLFFGVVVIIITDRTFVTKSINAAIGMLFDSLILANKLRVQ